MDKKLIIIILFSLSIFSADSSEKNVHKSPLHIYSGGISIGAIKPINERLDRVSSQFVKISFNNMIYFKKQLHLIVDIDWFGPGKNFGGDFGINYFFLSSDFTPYMGAGIGAHYFHRKDKEINFGDSFGPSIKTQVGLFFNITETFQMKIQIPYHVTINEFNDQCFGVEILFSGRYRNVNKLNYNKKKN